MKDIKLLSFLFVVVFAAGMHGSLLHAQSINDISHLTQMPVAVHKLVEAGIPADQVGKISSALNRGNISPKAFNETLRKVPYLSEKLNGITGVGDFVTNQVQSGLRGEELARAIHGKLRSFGIPAGGFEGVGTPPIADRFIPPQAKQKIEDHIRKPSRAMDRPQRGGPGYRPEPSSGPSGSPGGFPSSRPGGGIPGGTGGPTGGGGIPGGVPGR